MVEHQGFMEFRRTGFSNLVSPKANPKDRKVFNSEKN